MPLRHGHQLAQEEIKDYELLWSYAQGLLPTLLVPDETKMGKEIGERTKV